MFIDSLLFAIAYSFSLILHNSLLAIGERFTDFATSLHAIKNHGWLILISAPLWVVLLSYVGIYEELQIKNKSIILKKIFHATIYAILILPVLSLLLKIRLNYETFIVIFFIVVIVLLFVSKILFSSFLGFVYGREYNIKNVIIAGSGKRAKNLASLINTHSAWGVKVIGFIDEEELVGKKVGEMSVIGALGNLAEIIDENVIDQVIFALPRKRLGEIESLIKICEKVGVETALAVDFFNLKLAKPRVSDLHGWPILSFRTTPHNVLDLFLKRLMDIVVSSIGLVLLSPLFLIIIIAIRATSKGPIFFRQRRCGLRGREFTLYKFRTMIDGADNQKPLLLSCNERKGPVFKIQKDPRITPVGRFLRKTSLDEIPQLLNVLVGDMSLVGPRPPLRSEVAMYDRWQRRRLSIRPGITCIHEVEARNDDDFDRWMKMDLEYIDNWSFSLDIKLIARSIFAVLKGTGC